MKKNNYKLSGGAIVELVSSIVLFISVFLPWIKISMPLLSGASSTTLTMIGWVGGSIIPYATYLLYFFLLLCIANTILKFFLRSRWMSVILLIVSAHILFVASEMPTDASAHHMQADLQMGFYIALMAFAALLVGVFIPHTRAKETQMKMSEEVANDETADNSSAGNEEMDESLAEEDEEIPDYRKYYIGGGVLTVLAILIGIFTCSGFKSSGGNDLLPVEKPAWEKFVVITQDAPLYKDADTNSPKLAVTQEDLESDDIARVFKWSDVPDRRGWTSYDVTVSTDVVLPVVSEKDDWYLVSYDDTELGCAECYVQKSNCREVKPEPITPELLAGMTEYNYYRANFGLQTEGKYKNICFISVMAEMEGCYVDVAVLTDGKLVNPMTRSVFTTWDKCTEATFELKDGQLQYREDMDQNGMLDARNIKTEADAELLFNLIPVNKSDNQEVAYYFPEVSKDRLFVFTQNLAEAGNGVISEAQEDPEDPEITQALNEFRDLIARVRGTVEGCERNGETTGNSIFQMIEEAQGELNDKVNRMTEEQIQQFEALCQKAKDLVQYADSVNNTATVAEAVDSTMVEM